MTTESALKPKAWLAWSSGKDSAWSLHKVRQSGEFEIVALLTTVNTAYHRVAMHAVRESLLEAQAAAAGLPLVKVPIPSPCSNEIYERAMSDAMAAHARKACGMSYSVTFFSRTFAPIAKSSSLPAG